LSKRFPNKNVSKSDNWFWSRITDFYDKDGDKPDEPSGVQAVKVVLKDAFDLIKKVEAIQNDYFKSAKNLDKQRSILEKKKVEIE